MRKRYIEKAYYLREHYRCKLQWEIIKKRVKKVDGKMKSRTIHRRLKQKLLGSIFGRLLNDRNRLRRARARRLQRNLWVIE